MTSSLIIQDSGTQEKSFSGDNGVKLVSVFWRILLDFSLTKLQRVRQVVTLMDKIWNNWKLY